MPQSSQSLDAKRERSRLRRDIRHERRTLGEERRRAAERAICRRIQNLGAYKQARTLAVYLAFDGEPSLKRLVEAARRHGKQIYAPVLLKSGMKFALITTAAGLDRNFFGIEEPSLDRLVDARSLDLVLTPLVAFDDCGARLGMGRGYYDRAFRFLRHRKCWSRPKLVGVGYSFQNVPALELQPWDIPLWGAVTETNTYHFGASQK